MEETDGKSHHKFRQELINLMGGTVPADVEDDNT
jgi:hypothetical protein